MQRLSGVLLMLAGASLGVYTYLPKPQDGAEKLAEVTRISAAPDRDVRATANSSIAGGAGLSGTNGAAAQQPPPAVAVSAAAVPAANSTANKTPGTWSTVVTAETASAPKLSSSKPADAETRAELTRDLQKELARVGCYEGEITGAWTPSTKRAMSAFMDRVNASLPIREPDYILLTLVQGHAAAACGVDCPAGQALNGDGRCVPQAVIAQAQKKSQRDEQRRAAQMRKAAEQERVAEARAAAERQRQAGQTTSAGKQAVASAEPEVLPWLAEDTAGATQGLKVVTRPREPLPGMMSIGGPEQTHPQVPSGSVAAGSLPATAPVIAPRPSSKVALAEPGEDADTSSAAPELKAPKPVPAERPQFAPEQRGMPGTKSGETVRQGLPGSKSGVTVRSGLPGSKSGVAVRPKSIHKSQLQPRRITAVRRPAPYFPPSAMKPPRPKMKYYAMNTGKVRRGQPRPGSVRFNLMQSLGGIY